MGSFRIIPNTSAEKCAFALCKDARSSVLSKWNTKKLSPWLTSSEGIAPGCWVTKILPSPYLRPSFAHSTKIVSPFSRSEEGRKYGRSEEHTSELQSLT